MLTTDNNDAVVALGTPIAVPLCHDSACSRTGCGSKAFSEWSPVIGDEVLATRHPRPTLAPLRSHLPQWPSWRMKERLVETESSVAD